MAETLAQLEAKLSRYQRSGIMSKPKIDGVKKQIADKKKQARTGVSEAQKQKQLNVPAKRKKDLAKRSTSLRRPAVKENNKEKQQLFFKGKNVTFTNAQRDKLAGGAGKGSSVIKNILKKIDNAETLEAANKHRRRFEKLFGVVAPKSTKEKEYINRAGTVDEFGGGKTPPKPKDNPRNKTTSETVSDKQKRDTQLGDKETKKAKAKSEDRRQKNQLNTTKESVKDQILRQGKRKYGKITADSTDEGMSKFSGFDNQKELEAEEEMNFQKGGMPKRKAFGKGGMYKTPKKTYGMSYGGVTRKLKGK